MYAIPPGFSHVCKLSNNLGIDLSFAQPPLPEAKGPQGELTGTDE
jgi:hypothetical protein